MAEKTTEELIEFFAGTIHDERKHVSREIRDAVVRELREKKSLREELDQSTACLQAQDEEVQDIKRKLRKIMEDLNKLLDLPVFEQVPPLDDFETAIEKLKI